MAPLTRRSLRSLESGKAYRLAVVPCSTMAYLYLESRLGQRFHLQVGTY